MNDRFKFRVWDTVGECYCPRSHYILLSDGTLIEEIGGEDVICDSKNIEFCTGLKDKNGKLIYEGDVVRYDNGALGMNTVVVKYNFDYAGFEPFVTYDYEYGEWVELDTVEVIGNVHEENKSE